ncbi:hypothetical protein GOP47_0022055 [Adiantum capillus-veneris]|uniref:AB hydrolase-1 domain-containing protein n=1 Tax=Adiantum capillus-veneris TaxID=13818 RepID=A0A9D4U8N3_ADICA|nr:hypothetical protein GOP47_0022055 [Adiantum capillus-veneris]
MGNALSCVLPPMHRSRAATWKSSKSYKFPRSKSSRQAKAEEELLQQQALAMALLQQQLRFERSASVRNHKSSTTPKHNLPRSSSARGPHVTDPILQPHQLLHNQEAFPNAKTRHFLLVHGGGFGAWCWYKIIALLEDTGFVTSAIDLAGSGIDSTDPNCIPSIEMYARPLTSFFDKLPETEKVILVGHDVGGVCISYAMESFQKYIAQAIFISATMINNGQRAFDVFAPEVAGPDELLRKVQIFNYTDKNTQSPTSIEFDKAHVKELFFNQTPAKDVALATVSLRPVPFGPLMERISITSENYGRIPRYYIMTVIEFRLRFESRDLQIKQVSLN